MGRIKKNLENTSLQNGTRNSCDSIEADQSQIVNYSEQQSTTEEIPKPKKKKTKEMHVEDESLIEQKETPKKKKIKKIKQMESKEVEENKPDATTKKLKKKKLKS